jgi:hypothetical protein
MNQHDTFANDMSYLPIVRAFLLSPIHLHSSHVAGGPVCSSQGTASVTSTSLRPLAFENLFAFVHHMTSGPAGLFFSIMIGERPSLLSDWLLVLAIPSSAQSSTCTVFIRVPTLLSDVAAFSPKTAQFLNVYCLGRQAA